VTQRTFEIALSVSLLMTWGIEFFAVRAISPSRRHVANVLIRRLGWWPALLGIPLAALPFYNTVMGVLLLSPSVLVAAYNLDRLWLYKSLGEKTMEEVLARAVGKENLTLAMSAQLGVGFLFAFLGGTFMLLAPEGTLSWAYWLGLGIIVFGAGLTIHKCQFLWSLHRQRSGTGVA
jgi:hypothetical protein